MKNFYQIYNESIKKVSPIKKQNGEYVLMVDLKKRKNNFGIANLSSVNGKYESFEDVYNDFVDNIYSVHKRNSKDIADEKSLKVIKSVILKRGRELINKIQDDKFLDNNRKASFQKIILKIYSKLKSDPLFLRNNILNLKKEIRVLLTCFVKGFTVDFINDLYLKNYPSSENELYKVSISDVNKFNSNRKKNTTFLDIDSLVDKYK